MNYTTLTTGIPGISGVSTSNLSTYLQTLFEIGISIAAAAAVVMIIVGGIQYMSTDAAGGKSEGKERITAALWGLLLALMSFLILNTINPQLVSTNLDIAMYKTDGNPAVPYVPDPNPTDQTYTIVLPDGTVVTVTKSGIGTTGGVSAPYTGNGFPATSGLTNDQVLAMINASGLLNLSPADAAKYFPNGVSAEAYLQLFAKMAYSESGFDPANNTTQHVLDGKSSFSSEGLFSLSVGDQAVKTLAAKYGISPQQVINNPTYNTEASINIMKGQIQQTGTIQGSLKNHYWGPLYRGEVK